MCMCMLHVHVHVTWHVHVIFCTCRRGFHLAVSRPIRSAWPRRTAALGCSWHCRGLQEAIFSRGTGVSQAALPPPSSFHLQRHSRATFSNCILPLATAQRHRYVCLHRAQLHRAMHTAYFPPSQVTPHGSRLTSAWTRACSPSPQKGSPRQMPFCRRGLRWLLISPKWERFHLPGSQYASYQIVGVRQNKDLNSSKKISVASRFKHVKPNNLILSNVSRARQPAWTHPRLCSDVSGERLRTVEFATEFAGPLNGDGGITPWTTTSPVLTQESASQEHISFAIELYGSYDPVETPKPLWAFRGAEDVVLNTSEHQVNTCCRGPSGRRSLQPLAVTLALALALTALRAAGAGPGLTSTQGHRKGQEKGR